VELITNSSKLQNTPAPRKAASKHRNRALAAAIVPRTAEEQKLYLENQQKALEAAKIRAAQVGNWEKELPKMSNRQIQGELKRVIRGSFLGEPASLLDSAEALIQSISLSNIRTRENLAGQLSAVLNPTIAASSPRHTL
jgi:hypothetical protein